MKRSEMVEDMATTLVLEHLALEDDLSWDKAQIIAEAVLFKQEELGMLPPEILVHDYHPESVFISQWEYENETK